MASSYASRASVKRCTCSMKAVADLVNLFIASVYIETVSVGCEPTTSSFFHIMASIPFVAQWTQILLFAAGQDWSSCVTAHGSGCLYVTGSNLSRSNGVRKGRIYINEECPSRCFTLNQNKPEWEDLHRTRTKVFSEPARQERRRVRDDGPPYLRQLYRLRCHKLNRDGLASQSASGRTPGPFRLVLFSARALAAAPLPRAATGGQARVKGDGPTRLVAETKLQLARRPWQSSRTIRCSGRLAGARFCQEQYSSHSEPQAGPGV